MKTLLFLFPMLMAGAQLHAADAQPEQLARCATEKLITHFTGAPIHFADHEVIQTRVFTLK